MWGPRKAKSPPPFFLPPPQACRLLEIPALVTEQNPKALGPTVPELGAQDLPRYPKTTFSMVPPLEGELQRRPHLTSVLLCGIETQACILVGGGGERNGGGETLRMGGLGGSWGSETP